MADPVLDFPADERFDCASCGKCCRTQWTIPVSAAARALIEPSSLFRRVKARIGDDPIHDTLVLGERAVLARTDAGGCVFLEGSLCGVHKELGVEAKPLGCRLFPFHVVETPDGLAVGLSFYCSAVQQRHGRPVSEHEAAVRAMVAEHAPQRVGFEPVTFAPGMRISWEAYQSFESLARQDASELGRGLFRLLTTAARIATSGDAAHEDPVADGAFRSALASARQREVRPDRLFFELEGLLVATIQAKLEASRDIEKTRANQRALLEGGAFENDRHGRVDVAALVEWRTRIASDGRDDDELRRYVRNLVHRKLLVTRTSVLDGAAALYLALRLVELNRDMAAFVRGAARPDTTDLHAAFDAVETGFAFHARGIDPIVAELGRAYADQVRALRSA